MWMNEDRTNSSGAVPQPLTFLFECPKEVEKKLGAATERRSFVDGQVLFEQNQACDGLYLILAGEFARATDRWGTRLSLSPLHAGDLVELAAILGDGQYTSTVTATSSAAVMVFPRTALEEAFAAFPPLRMRLLEELGREVSRAYAIVSFGRGLRTRRSRKGSSC